MLNSIDITILLLIFVFGQRPIAALCLSMTGGYTEVIVLQLIRPRRAVPVCEYIDLSLSGILRITVSEADCIYCDLGSAGTFHPFSSLPGSQDGIPSWWMVVLQPPNQVRICK